MRPTLHFLWLSALAFVFVPLVNASAAPNGAVKLSKSKLTKKNGFYCGRVKNSSWIPGKLISGGYFYSHQAEKNNLSKELKTAAKNKKAQLQKQIKTLTSLITTRSKQCSGSTSGNGKALRFNFAGAVGLTLSQTTGSVRGSSGSSKSNLKKVSAAGKVSAVVVSGSAMVSKFLIAPNNKLYVLFQEGTNLSDTTSSGKCLLAEVDTTTGEPVCIDSAVSSIVWLEEEKNPSIQFDSSGAIYYLAYSSDNKVALRKYDGSTTRNIINDNIDIYDFLVMPDSGIILHGRTRSTRQQWIRKVAPSGGLGTIKNMGTSGCNTGLNFIRLFPDNKVYFGLDDCYPGGIYRMEQTADTFEPQPWMGVSKTYDGGSLVDLPTPVAFDCYSPTDPTLQLPQGCGSYVTQSFRTPDGKMFFLGGSNNKLFKYYPTVEKPATAVSKPVLALGVAGNLILAGLNTSDKNILTLFNTSDSSEISLIGPSTEIEIYHLNYVASSNDIMFDGLRFSDNKYVIGRYDLNTMTFVASPTGDSKLVDFQTF